MRVLTVTRTTAPKRRWRTDCSIVSSRSSASQFLNLHVGVACVYPEGVGLPTISMPGKERPDWQQITWSSQTKIMVARGRCRLGAPRRRSASSAPGAAGCWAL